MEANTQIIIQNLIRNCTQISYLSYPPSPRPYLVEGLIDSLVVVSLHRAKVWLDQLEVANASEEGNAACVIEARGENNQQVVDKQGLVVEVELKGLVVELNVGDLCDDVLEVALLPGLRGMGHHGQNGVVIFLVLVVEEDQLGPEVGLLSCTKNLA